MRPFFFPVDPSHTHEKEILHVFRACSKTVVRKCVKIKNGAINYLRKIKSVATRMHFGISVKKTRSVETTFDEPDYPPHPTQTLYNPESAKITGSCVKGANQHRQIMLSTAKPWRGQDREDVPAL